MDNIQRYVEHFDAQKARVDLKRHVVVGPTQANIVENGTIVATVHLSNQHTDNGLIRETETSYYTRKDYDDGSFIIQQSVIGPIDKTIKFGPLTAKLSELFAMGFILEIQGWRCHRNQKLRLIRGKEQYKLQKIPTHELGKHQDLTQWVKDYTKPHFEPYTVEPKPKQIIKEVRIETDPFEQLTLRYPVRRKTVEFVGNQTLEQYVKQQLREQRRLENVV